MILNKQIDLNDCSDDVVGELLGLYGKYDIPYELPPWRKWEYSWAITNLPIKEGVRWLDIGPGKTVLPFYLLDKNVHITVSEIGMYDYYSKFPNIKYVEATELSKLQDSSFDVITCISVMEHLKENEKEDSVLMNELARLLCPGGILYITTDVSSFDFNSFRAGHKGELYWHWYSVKSFTENIIKVGRNVGLHVYGDATYERIDFKKGIPGLAVDLGDRSVTIMCLFMIKE